MAGLQAQAGRWHHGGITGRRRSRRGRQGDWFPNGQRPLPQEANSVSLELPDATAQAARDAGLLTPPALECPFNDALRRKGVNELFEKRNELTDVLSREKWAEMLATRQTHAAYLMPRYGLLAKVVRPKGIGRVVPNDPDDDAVIACALAARADLIVSGDKHLLSLGGQYQGIPIVTPSPGHLTRRQIEEGPHQRPFFLRERPVAVNGAIFTSTDRLSPCRVRRLSMAMPIQFESDPFFPDDTGFSAAAPETALWPSPRLSDAAAAGTLAAFHGGHRVIHATDHLPCLDGSA